MTVYPLCAFVDFGNDHGGESLAVLLRQGKAGSNTVDDHIKIFDLVLKLKRLCGVAELEKAALNKLAEGS